jgi:uncharacterized membrane protein YcaP (DUF421 family)
MADAPGTGTPEPGMWELTVPWWHFVVRAVIIYAFLLVVLRLTGKRQVGQLAPFDLVLLLILSNAVQNAMNAGDNSVTAGIILVVTLIGLNTAVGLATYKSKWMEALLEGRPMILVHNGHVYSDVMASAKITHHELMAALRREGVAGVEDVHLAVLENTGQISVVPKKERPGRAERLDSALIRPQDLAERPDSALIPPPKNPPPPST